MKKIVINSIQSIDNAAQQFVEHFMLNSLNPKSLYFAFFGDLGAGKTTFIKALCRQLGVIDLVSSPSFAIINEYQTDTNKFIYHFDFYRIKDTEEIFDIGYEEYIQSENICFIEWPEKIEEHLPENFVAVHIKEIEEEKRLIEFEG